MNTITVVGLGPGHMDQMPLRVFEVLKRYDTIYVRTGDHPAVEELKKESFNIKTFDHIYNDLNEEFEKVYPEIVAQLFERAAKEDILYAVPGHPMVAEKTVQLLLEDTSDVRVEVVDGKSFIDDLFQAVNADPVEGFQLVDGLDFSTDHLSPNQHVVLMQVFSPLVASDVKLDLMAIYPDEHEVALVDAAGTPEQTVKWCPLYELDFFEGVHNLLSVYVPPLERDQQIRSFATLQSYTDEILGPEGDAWIKNKSARDLIPYIKEETQELVEALEKDDIDNTIEELGDVLMQVLYQAKIAETEGLFALEDVLAEVNTKLRRRHPHVFDNVEARTPEEVDALWQKIKEKEREERENEAG